jgi:hypothetical protein
VNTRTIVISDCKDCVYFDNEYYEFLETCTKLKRPMPPVITAGPGIKTVWHGRPIPDDCPLPKDIPHGV